ncbi:response regulator transcription factor [Actinospica durhamensis]|uniref:Response regulator transcription factor n=1 Tax=Actinospica durhamensis TaxID=1508375 RepID=A0A941IN44_9ACTN|nr:LuxR C-terminal-related transcriptional regulator [Actinospica durhamensis]MBR7831642.1 response regulator transcription factor [Actinospica durhamensis]
MADIASNMGEQVLHALGLDPVSVQVYLAMHATTGADAEQLAGKLNLQVSEVVDALDELSDLTLLRPGLSPADRLRPVSIERALHTLLRQQSDQLTAQTEAIRTLQAAMDELFSMRPVRSDVLREIDVEVIIGREAMQTRIEALFVQAQQSIYSMLPGGPLPKPSLDAARPWDREAIERGVHVRALYQNSVRGDRGMREYMEWFTQIGAEVRTAPVIPMRLIMIDRTTAVVVQPHPHELFLIRETGILFPLNEYCELVWASAERFEAAEREAEPDALPTSQELALLRLLAAGSIDEAAAKKLGISVRTVRRMMADLMERLGATSRFEAGYKATKRGWL